jgi:hypothetical protein
MLLRVDNREAGVLSELQLIECPHQVCVLNVGDFLIADNQGNPHFVIERKTYADLASSIIDGLLVLIEKLSLVEISAKRKIGRKLAEKIITDFAISDSKNDKLIKTPYCIENGSDQSSFREERDGRSDNSASENGNSL